MDRRPLASMTLGLDADRRYQATMSLVTTLVILTVSILLAGFANWRERRPTNLNRPSLISYPALQMVAFVIILLMIAHLISLLSGQPFRGRSSL